MISPQTAGGLEVQDNIQSCWGRAVHQAGRREGLVLEWEGPWESTSGLAAPHPQGSQSSFIHLSHMIYSSSYSVPGIQR